MTTAGPNLYVITCDSCGAIEGTPKGDETCTDPRWDGLEDTGDGHDWSGIHRWPLATCLVCGCTEIDCSGCIERTGGPCSWVDELEDDTGPICSACVPAESRL